MTIQIKIDVRQKAEPITKYIYGQFIEHLDNLITHGLWAEMLDDRKFYYSVGRVIEDARPHRMLPVLRTWQPVGPAEAVQMDTSAPYSGEHTPLVHTVNDQPRGIRQSGIMVREGKRYVGRVVLAGDAAVRVRVSLIWGDGPAKRQSVEVGPLSAEYAKFPVAFEVGADSNDACLEIVGTGQGEFHIGAASLMPADNLKGFRADTIALLKQLKSGIYRFPGGNYVSNHDWRDAIGDIDRRPSRWDYAWNVMQPNDVGTDEFMVLCELLDVEPYITVNAGYGEARAAADWVEYANGSIDTPMGRLRAANGHPEPYGIKWWGIGNEMYGWWQHGYMSLEHYCIKHNLFAQAMRKVDPSIKLIASGASVDEMTVTRNAKRVTGRVLAEYGDESDWTGGLLAKCGENIDVISEHYYAQSGRHFDLKAGDEAPLVGHRGGWVDVQEPLIEWARKPANRVRCKAEAYAEYVKRHPILDEKGIPVNIDEWAYPGIGSNLRVDLAYAWAFQEMFRHSGCIKMAAYTFATSCIDWNRAESCLNAVGVLFQFYRDHMGLATPVGLAGDSPQPAPMYPVGGDQPQVNAGSPTYPLDMVAALSEDGRSLRLAVLNPTEQTQSFELDVVGLELSGAGTLWQLGGPSLAAENALGQAAQVSVCQKPLPALNGAITIDAISIYILECEIG